MPDGPALCSDCGAEIPPASLACPVCARLVHSSTLKELAARAEAAERSGDLSAALLAWRDALGLLPQESRQHASVLARLRSLSAQVEAGGDAKPARGWKQGAAGLGGALVLLLTKGKFLLLGLTKLPTLLSMLAWAAVYWTLWGWKFALAMVVSIYIHEMGHVWMLRRYGIRATAPMFIPGVGALVRLQQPLATVIEDARVGLAGPMWGLAAAGAAYGLYVATGEAFWGGVAQLGAVINLFNLIPIWQLDGGRGIQSLSRGQRWLVALAAGGMYYFTGQANSQNFFLLVIAGVLVLRAAMGTAPRERDDLGLFQFVLLLMLLGGLAAVQVPQTIGR